MWVRQGPAGMRPGLTSLMGLNPLEMRHIVEDEATRDKLHKIMQGNRTKFRSAMKDSIEAHQNFRAALEASPFDADQLSQAFEASRLADDQMRRLSQGTVEDFINSLTDEERSALLAELKERRWWKMGRGKMGPRMDGEGPRGLRRERWLEEGEEAASETESE